MPSELMKIINLRKWFEIGWGFFKRPDYVKAVDDVSLDIGKGEVFSIVGESGSGKTTLGKTIIRLLEPTGGKILFNAEDITHVKEKELKWFRMRVGLVQQDPYSTINPSFAIYKALEEPLIIHSVDAEERRKRIDRGLKDVDLTPPEAFWDVYPHLMSGGERQRVGVARAMIFNPEFVFADEPVSMLDASVKVEILELFEKLRKKRGIAFLHTTHDLATAKYFSDRIAIMYAGKVVEQGSGREILKDPLHPYTQALIKAIPDPDPANRFRKLKVLPGTPPDLVRPPKGCRLHPRCPYATEKCKKNYPPFESVSRAHYVSCWYPLS